MLTEAARTAQPAFEEVGAAKDVLDDASGLGEDQTTALAETLRRGARAEVPALLGTLRAQAVRVERSEAVRTIANRILGNGGPDEPAALAPVPVRRRGEGEREPRRPVGASGTPGAGSGPVRGEQVEHVAAHLVALAERIVDRTFLDVRFTRATLDETDRAYALWCACLDEG
ncbi:hypothetical protein AB0L83_21065 [Streptomyces sp. NPDC052071]|uniref:hypothetical protein n=1 Tax=Streptomyces TaxID=1883 RepID=UPI002E11D7B2|nr:hypothetical protein OG336_07540 [[Kitasatospora] papulosa]